MRANARRMTVPAVLDGLVLAAFAGAMLTIGGATLDAGRDCLAVLRRHHRSDCGIGDRHVDGRRRAPVTPRAGDPSRQPRDEPDPLPWLRDHRSARREGVSRMERCRARGRRLDASLGPEVERHDGVDVLAIVVIAILVAILCHHAAGALPSIQATGIVPVWSDYSIHGTEIAQFGDQHVLGLSSFLLAGQPLVFYHYAPYMLPAAAAGVVNLPPWGLAASLLLPYGVLLMSLAAYAFARMQLGAAAAMIAPAALLLVPDASTYGLRNGFFGFHWLLFSAPGSGYGLAAAFTALTLMAIWRSRQLSACLWLGILVTAAAFEFRAQIFLLLAPAWQPLSCARPPSCGVTRGLRLVAVAVTAIAVVMCLATWDGARDAWLRFSALRPFLDVVHSGMSPTAYDGAYKAIDGRYGPLVGTTLGVLALIPAALGAFALALPIAVRRSGTAHRLARSRYFPNLVCRRVARSGDDRAGGAPWRPYRVSAPAIRSHLCIGRHLDAAVRRAPLAERSPFGRGSAPRPIHDAGRRNHRRRAGRAGTKTRPAPVLRGARFTLAPSSMAVSSTQRHSSGRAPRRATPLPSSRQTQRAGSTTVQRGWRHWLECRPTWRGRASRRATTRHAGLSSSNACRSCTVSRRQAKSTPPSRRCGASAWISS